MSENVEKGGAPAGRARLVEVGPEQAGQRLDNFAQRELRGVPRSRIYRALRKGEIRVNKGRARADRRLQRGDQVRLPPLQIAGRGPERGAGTGPMESPASAAGVARMAQLLETGLLYQDGGLWVIDKPAGLAVHGGSGLSYGLIEALRQLRPRERFLELVHRLDRDTSGCVMVARKASALRHLHGQLRQDQVDKGYLALVGGRWPTRRRSVEAPLRKNTLKSGERLVRVDDAGKPARTDFNVLRRFDDCTLVEARPRSGRTHQIRVHCQHAGHPILGDEKYGDRAGNRWAAARGLRRLFLHAAVLGFETPAGERVRVEAPLAADLQRFLNNLAASSGAESP